MLIISQNKEKVMRFGISFNTLKYAERTDRKGKQTIVRHTICISDGLLEEVAEYESKERCMEVLKEFCEAYTDGYYTTEYFDDSAKPHKMTIYMRNQVYEFPEK